MKLKITLVSILTLAFLLRTWQLSIIPFGFTPDEASFGYDAFSILETGKDQWGHFLPLTLESFGDFKLPLYSYIAIPSIALFGLNVFATRLPNAITGTLAVFATFLMVREFLKINKLKNSLEIGNANPTSLWKLEIVASIMLAISPWHIMMSRGAFEANLTTLLMPLGVYFFLRFVSSQVTNYLLLASTAFGLNLFSYHSARLVTPFILISLILFFRNELLASGGLYRSLMQKKAPILVFATFLVFAIYTLTVGGARRAQDIIIFTGATESAYNERLPYLYHGISQNTARIFVNKYHIIGKRFFENYTQYISPKFLFIDGPAEATYGMIPGRGVMYWFEVPFILLFFYSLARAKDKRLHLFILAWVLVAPIPASLTMGKGYAANRAETMLPALTVMSAIGFLTLHSVLKSKLNTKFLTISYTLVFIYSLCSFSIDYFVVSPLKTSKAMLWGNLEVANWLKQNADGKNVILSRKLSEPQMYIAFANVWDPKEYQVNSKNWEIYRENNLKFLDQVGEYDLGNYKFTEIKYSLHRSLPNTLLVGRLDEFPNDAPYLAKFIDLNGETAVVVLEAAKEVYANKN